MTNATSNLGLGIGWRPELAMFCRDRRDLGFVEITAENHPEERPNESLAELKARGVRIIPHGVSLSLGGAERVAPERVDRLEKLARMYAAPLVSEHIAFVRAGGIEIGHLTPIPRTRTSLKILVENVRDAQARLSVPLALENIAAMFEWPDAEMSEADFLNEILDQTRTTLLLDISNVYANACNLKTDAMAFLRQLPTDRISYVHMGGGVIRNGVVHDTHSDPILPGAMQVLEQFCEIAPSPGVMVERDDHFPTAEQLHAELDAISRAMKCRAAKAEHV